MTWGSKRGGPGGKNSLYGDQKGHKGLEKHLKTIRLVLLVRFRGVKIGQKFLKKSAFYVVWLTEIYIIGYCGLIVGDPYLGIWDYLDYWDYLGTICTIGHNDLKDLFLNDTIAKRALKNKLK